MQRWLLGKKEKEYLNTSTPIADCLSAEVPHLDMELLWRGGSTNNSQLLKKAIKNEKKVLLAFGLLRWISNLLDKRLST